MVIHHVKKDFFQEKVVDVKIYRADSYTAEKIGQGRVLRS